MDRSPPVQPGGGIVAGLEDSDVGKRTFAIVVVVFVLLGVAVAALHGGGDGRLVDWLRSLHGR